MNGIFQTDTATITIKVMDENDCDPLFGQLRYNFTIREEQKGGIVVGTVNVSTEDQIRMALVIIILLIYRGYSNFLLNMAFISPSEVENIYIS